MVLITHPYISLGAGAFEVGRAKEKEGGINRDPLSGH